MEEIEEFIDKLEDNIRWWKRAMETDGFESDDKTEEAIKLLKEKGYKIVKK